MTHVGGSTWDGVPWGLTEGEAIARIESRLWEYFVEVPSGDRVSVLVKVSSAGNKFLTTSPDGVAANNLDNLPNLPQPLSGVDPQFPLSIPGMMTTTLTTIDMVSHTGGGQLHAMGGPIRVGDGTVEFLESSTFFTPQVPVFYLDAHVPFPASYLVWEDSTPVERVDPSDNAAKQALVAAGKGWWSMEFVLTDANGNYDPNLPARLTPVKIQVLPSQGAWASQNFVVALFASSLNSYCLGQGEKVSFRVKLQGAPAISPAPSSVVLPNVVGLQLDKALTELAGLGLTNIFVLAPSAPPSSEKVDTQNPAAGTHVGVHDRVSLTASLIAPRTGYKDIIVRNDSMRQDSLDIWLYDLTTGIWDKKKTVAYQAQATVAFTSGHEFLLAAVDPSLNSCHSGQPTEATCVYYAPLGSYLGDSGGGDATLDIP